MPLYVKLSPRESDRPEKTIHTVLKRPQASWAQSVFSVTANMKLMPNRDYPYEGLSMVVDDDNWHILDGIAVGLTGEGGRLEQRGVTAYPWKTIYHYAKDDLNLDVEYYLLRTNRQVAAARVLFTASRPVGVAVEPFADIRHMYDSSHPREHAQYMDEKLLMVDRDGIKVLIGSPNTTSADAWNLPVNWHYKLGSGYRRHSDGGADFVGEDRMITSIGELRIHVEDRAPLVVTAGTSQHMLKEMYWRTLMECDENEKREKARAAHIVEKLKLKPGSGEAFRALALFNYGIRVRETIFHDAGEFWFRTPWLRDQFEGILHNMKTLVKFREGRMMVEEILLNALAYQHQCGLIPNRILGRGMLDYNSADAVLLAYIAAGKYASLTENEELIEKVLGCADVTIKAFHDQDESGCDGIKHPVAQDNGLITTVPWHSWIDSHCSIEWRGRMIKIPSRVPREWVYEGLTLSEEETLRALDESVYYLPEINAQWIRALLACAEMCKLLDADGSRYSELADLALGSYRSIFGGERVPICSIVTLDGRADETWGSPAVVAAALLGEKLLKKNEIRKFVSGVREHLLVKRGARAFGIMVRENRDCIYCSDNEYHDGVVWPRDTPYLIKLLRMAGEQGTVREILESNLDHQMNEGFIFYNAELFSVDHGDVTPVKNPVQFWSQWADPYMKQSSIVPVLKRGLGIIR